MKSKPRLANGKKKIRSESAKAIGSEWQKLIFAEVAEIDSERLNGLTSPNYTFRYISLSDVDKGKICPNLEEYTFRKSPSRARLIVKQGDVLLGTVRPGLQAFAQIREKLVDHIASTGFAVLRAKQGFVSNYIYQYLYSDHFTKQVNEIIAGSNYPAISSSDVAKLKIFLPKDAIEQQKIAGILNTWDKVIEKTEQLVESKQKLKKGLVQQMLSGKIRSKQFSTMKPPGDVKTLPEGWRFIPFGEIVAKAQYGLSKASSQDGIYPIFKMNHFDNGRMTAQEIDKISLSKDEFKQFKLNKGDILFNRTNSYELVGKTAIFDLERDCTFASYIVRFSLNLDIADPYYINYFFNATSSQRRLKDFATKGVSQSNINPTNLQKFFHVILPPLKEQNKMSAVLRVLDREIAMLSSRLDLLRDQKKGLMQKLLTGQVRVKTK